MQLSKVRQALIRLIIGKLEVAANVRIDGRLHTSQPNSVVFGCELHP